MLEINIESSVNKDKRIGLFMFNLLIILFIVYLQFQNILGVPIKESMPQLSHAIFLADKIFFFSLLIVFIYFRFLGSFLTPNKNTIKIKTGFVPLLKNEIILIISLIIFVLWSLISAAINQNSLELTIFGTFAYVVYFLVFFVFSSISYEKELIKKTYLFLLKLALFLSIISVSQELLAFIYPDSVLWWPNIQSGKAMWRLGFFRAPSLLGHPNGIGLFALFFWTVELARIKELGLRKNWLRVVILGLAVLFSVSRSAIGGALIALFFLSFSRHKAIALSLPVIAIGVFLFISYLQSPTTSSSVGIFDYDNYRKFAMEKSLNIFKDHPFYGVGAGMYGGHISLRYNSPIYTEYGFTGVYFDYLHDRVGSIEQQWFQVLVELGVIGTILIIILMATPIFILYRLLKKEKDIFFKVLIIGLMVMPLQMFFYMLGFTLTQNQQWLIPYFVFVGMLVGMQRKVKR